MYVSVMSFKFLGQSIPKGLHVRLNLQTGEREAKLLDDADADKNVRQINIPETEGDSL